MLKENKGITLVALVITIIVLLILAGVSISLVVGDNGVLTQSQSAAKKTDEADAKQALEMAISSCQGDFVNVWTNDTTQTFQSYLTAALINTAIGDEYTVDSLTHMSKGTNEYTFSLTFTGKMGAKVATFTKDK